MSDTTQPVCSFADLLALLQKDGVPHEANLPGAELIIPTQRGALDAVLLLRWQQDAGVVQFIQPLPFEVPKERIPAIEAAVLKFFGVANEDELWALLDKSIEAVVCHLGKSSTKP